VASQQIRERLVAAVGPDSILDDPYDLLVYEYDASDEAVAGIHQPDFVVIPTTAEQVAEVVRIARDFNVPVTPRGAGTGLAGGAIAAQGGIMVVLTRMTKILEVNYLDRYAIVEPGLINLDLSVKTTPDGYFFAPDPSSQKACTIGGNIANNSGGPHCLKYGVTSNHILGLEVVLPNGELIWVGGATPESPGIDLTGVLVGSEGTIGIVTKAMVRLTRNPEEVNVLMAPFPTIETASAAVSAIIAAGILPAALEMMDALTIQAVEAAFNAGYPKDAGAVLLIELDGLAEAVAESTDEIVAICKQHDAVDVRVATSKAERDLLWLGRKAAFGAMGRLTPNYYLQDTVVPRTKLPETLGRVGEIARDYNLQIANVFHAGDGNLHPLILFDRYKPGELERVLHAGTEMLHWCVDVGGAISGEHGIGLEKKEHLTLMFSPDDLAAMAGLKQSFDPMQYFNPDKIFPSGTGCGEIDSVKQHAKWEKMGIHVV
jgi:glycolate oxidase